MRMLFCLALSLPGLAWADLSVFNDHCLPNEKMCAFFSPSSPSFQAIGELIESARGDLKIAAYGMKVQEFVPLLEKKLSEGVRVTIIMDYKHSLSSKQIIYHLGPSPLLTILQVPVLRGRFPQMHNKFMIVDHKKVVTGSGNFSHYGLAGNFENFVLIEDVKAVEKFASEFEELASASRLACELLSDSPTRCGTAAVTWPTDIDTLFQSGQFPKSALVVDEGTPCYFKSSRSGQLQSRLGAGLLTAGNQVRIKNIKKCFQNESLGQKVETFLSQVAANETYWDGTRVSVQPITGIRRPMKSSPIEVYFGPEDNLTQVIQRELQTLLDHPEEAYFYASLNFFTHPELAKDLKLLEERGGRVRLIYDGRRGRAQQMAKPIKQLSGRWLLYNSLVGEFGMNHNKFALFGRGSSVSVVTGSANWTEQALGKSGGTDAAVKKDPNSARNDENLVIVRNNAFSSLFFKEWLAQFRYLLKNTDSKDLWIEDLKYLSQHVPCLQVMSGERKECLTDDGQAWTPAAASRQITTLTLESATTSPNTFIVGLDSQSQQAALFVSRPFSVGEQKNRWIYPLSANGHNYNIHVFDQKAWWRQILTLIPFPEELWRLVNDPNMSSTLGQIKSGHPDPDSLWSVKHWQYPMNSFQEVLN
ncbi:MAG: hypothetical protein H6626_13925 [Pseudobdellovibrionaceae bacterium]|nr:hypothetical protein [Bdellovibrionales bacterium]USN47268.1 MAG: hypothetical protein H6626_13925 [Pseudobdellovibrionaceae bacterium]